MHKDTREILYTEEQIRDRSAELGKQISADYEGKDVLMVGLLKGSVPFFAELAKHVALDVEFDFMRVSSYEGTESTGNVIVKKDIDVDFKGKDILSEMQVNLILPMAKISVALRILATMILGIIVGAQKIFKKHHLLFRAVS